MTLRQGEVVAGRFRVEALAGTGGMGSVYRAVDEVNGGEVALKILARDRETDYARFSREATLLRELRHPAIVGYVAHGNMPNVGPWLAMEWVRGRTLADMLNGPLDAGRSVHIALAVAGALAHAHRKKVVHRDIKPRNIMVGDDGAVKVLDFGIARARHEVHSLTRTGIFLGTPGYIAPEQARGERDVDARADLFSLGCVLFECLTGRPAFVAFDVMALLAKLVVEAVPRPSELVPGVPPAVDAVVLRMLEKHPDDRHADADELVRELEQAFVSLAPTMPMVWDDGVARRLTEGELKLLSVVIATGDGEAEVTYVSAPDSGGAVSSASLTRELATLGIRLERLADGSVVCVITGTEIATDLAARAARCALVLRQHLVGRPVVIGTGRALMAGALPAGEVIDAAVVMLRRLEALPDDDPTRAWVGIDPLTAGLLDASFDVRGHGGHLFLAREREPLDVRRRLLGRDAPFIGRDRDLAFLVSLFEECRDEPAASVVAVIANAGMGKSRLLSELLARLGHERAATVLVAKGDALAAQSPLSLVAQLIRRAAAIQDDEPLDVKLAKLAARVLRNAADEREAERIADFLGELANVRRHAAPENVQPMGGVGHSPTPNVPASEGRPHLSAARLDPTLMREEVERAWRDFIGAETEAQPLVLVLEDLQWGDLPSVNLIELALRAHRDRPLLVVIAGRPGTEVQFASFWSELGVHELRLAKLSRAAMKAMVRGALGDAVPEARLEAIIARADGNAFFLEELIRAVAETSSAKAAGSEAALARSDTLPETLVAMVDERLAGLDPLARRLLRAASVFGETFWNGAVRALLGDSSGPLNAIEHWLGILAGEEIVVSQRRSRFQGQDEWSFRHALLREAAYASLVPQDRTVAHRAAGFWLESAGESDAALLAEHFERGQEAARAAMYYRKAAETALEGHDLDVASARAERGIACGATGEELGRLHLVRAEVHALRGENAEAERSCTEVLALVPPGSAAWCWAAGTTAALRVQLGEVDGAAAIAEALAGTTPSDAVAAMAYLRGAAQAMPYLLYGGRYDVARRLRAAATSASGSIDPGLGPVARGWSELLAAEVAAWTEGDPHAALVRARAAMAAFKAGRSELAAAAAGIAVAEALFELGLLAEAWREVEAATAMAEHLGARFYAARGRMVRGAIEAARGQPEAGRTHVEAAIEEFYRQGNTTYFGIARMTLAGILAQLGDHEGALREASEAELLALFATPALRAVCAGVVGHVQLALGRAEDALAAFVVGADIVAELGAVAEGETRLGLGHADALRALGRDAEASAVLHATAERLRARADRIAEAEMKRAFLEKRDEHKTLLARDATTARD